MSDLLLDLDSDETSMADPRTLLDLSGQELAALRRRQV
jgi:hypothetical protein